MPEYQAAIIDLEARSFKVAGHIHVLGQTALKSSQPVWFIRKGVAERVKLVILSSTDMYGSPNPHALIQTETEEPPFTAVSTCSLEGLLESLHLKEPIPIDADPEEIVRRPRRLIRYIRQKLDFETWRTMSIKQRSEFTIGSHGIHEIAALLGLKYFSIKRRADHLRLGRAIYEELPRHT